MSRSPGVSFLICGGNICYPCPSLCHDWPSPHQSTLDPRIRGRPEDETHCCLALPDSRLSPLASLRLAVRRHSPCKLTQTASATSLHECLSYRIAIKRYDISLGDSFVILPGLSCLGLTCCEAAVRLVSVCYRAATMLACYQAGMLSG